MNNSITFYAFRYCLGRQSYAVAECVEYLLDNWESIEYGTRLIMISEIEEANDENRAGMESMPVGHGYGY